MHDNVATLMGAIMAGCLIYGLAWGVMGMLMQLAPKSTGRLAAGNLLVGCGLVLGLQRTEAPSYLFYQVSDWVVLAGLLAFREGVLFLLQAEIQPLYRRLAPLALAVVATVGIAPDGGSNFIMTLAFAIPALWLALHTFLLSYRGPDASTFSRYTRFLISFPFLATAVAMAFRIVEALAKATSDGPAVVVANQDNMPFLWSMLVMVLLINIALSALAGARLVSNLKVAGDRDTLTGFWSRSGMEERIRLAFTVSHQASAPLSCIYLDVDRLGLVNDLMGYTAGDKAIQQVASVVAQQAGAGNLVGRWGGASFLIFLPGLTPQEAAAVAERVRNAVASAPFEFQSQSMGLTVSIGVAQLAPAESQISLIHRADAALQTAKRLGRNRIAMAAAPAMVRSAQV